jgi:predicted nucleic acid-binding protein
VIVADASWIIALRDPGDEHHAEAVLLNDIHADEEMLLHPVTLAECLVAPAKLGVLDDAASALRAAFQLTDLDPDAPVRWARLRADTGLRLPDCVVLDTAITRGATGLVTFDDALAGAAATHGIETQGRA